MLIYRSRGEQERKKRKVSSREIDFAMPEGLSAKGKKAYKVIMGYLEEKGLDHAGGCKVFFNPAEWKARGELYGHESELVVVYDGGDHSTCFSDYHGRWADMEGMVDALASADLYLQPATCWYGSIYEI